MVIITKIIFVLRSMLLVTLVWVGSVLTIRAGMSIKSLVEMGVHELASRTVLKLYYVLVKPVDKMLDLFTEVVFPSPPEPEPTLYDSLKDYIVYLERYDTLLNRQILYTVIGITTILVVMTRYFRACLYSTMYRIRGVQYESMREGSVFRTAKIPIGQIEVMGPGLLSDQHIGYGLRIQDVLVVPSHVIAGRSEVILKYTGPAGVRRILYPLSSVCYSKTIPDLSYVFLTPKHWVSLGAAKASVYGKDFKSLTVSCTGREGASDGLLMKSSTMGMLCYNGSTVPGMSGAAYHVNGTVYGMHSGVIMENNVGISMMLILLELKRYMRGEDSSDFAEHNTIKIMDEKRYKAWNVDALDRVVEDSWTNNEEPMDYDQILDFSESARTRNDVEKAHKIMDAYKTLGITPGAKVANTVLIKDITKNVEGQVTLNTQGLDGVEAVYRSTVQMVPKQEMVDLVNAMAARIADLEMKVSSINNLFQKCDCCDGMFTGITLAEHKRIHTRFPCAEGGCEVVCNTQDSLAKHAKHNHALRFRCDRCDVSCRNAERLARHRESCKVKVVYNATAGAEVLIGESAVPFDNKKQIKTTSFLETRNQLPKVKVRKFKSTSPVSVKKHQSPSLAEALLKMSQSQQNIEKSLEKLVRNMAGPALETKRN